MMTNEERRSVENTSCGLSGLAEKCDYLARSMLALNNVLGNVRDVFGAVVGGTNDFPAGAGDPRVADAYAELFMCVEAAHRLQFAANEASQEARACRAIIGHVVGQEASR